MRGAWSVEGPDPETLYAPKLASAMRMAARRAWGMVFKGDTLERIQVGEMKVENGHPPIFNLHFSENSNDGRAGSTRSPIVRVIDW